jgi:hypothetical protein
MVKIWGVRKVIFVLFSLFFVKNSLAEFDRVYNRKRNSGMGKQP